MDNISEFRAPQNVVLRAPDNPWNSLAPELAKTIIGGLVMAKIKGSMLRQEQEGQQAWEREKIGLEQGNMMDRIFAQQGWTKDENGQWQKPQMKIEPDESGYLKWSHGNQTGVLQPLAQNLETMNIPGTQKAIVRRGKDSHIIDQSLPFDANTGPQFGPLGNTGAYWIRTAPNSVDLLKPQQHEPSKEFKRVQDTSSPTGYSYQDFSGNKIPGAVPPAESGTLTEPTVMNQLNLLAGADPERYNKYIQTFKGHQSRKLSASDAFAQTLNDIGGEQRTQRLTELGVKYNSPEAIKKAFQKGELDQDSATSLLRANHGYK